MLGILDLLYKVVLIVRQLTPFVTRQMKEYKDPRGFVDGKYVEKKAIDGMAYLRAWKEDDPDNFEEIRQWYVDHTRGSKASETEAVQQAFSADLVAEDDNAPNVEENSNTSASNAGEKITNTIR